MNDEYQDLPVNVLLKRIEEAYYYENEVPLMIIMELIHALMGRILYTSAL